ncbi:hypothetical protein NE237_028043 [Protea cynaroides]|uniref:Uncharacterized protein n=1 Tax=Protea cynaroides TaxID=273540 RepID=A0A9Q0JTJ6_9MAGN|nr:hypothetical protein NE237_028043 [Protea cynaroides]
MEFWLALRLASLHVTSYASMAEQAAEALDPITVAKLHCALLIWVKTSREFLHSGNDKEKFKFFYKATLLEQLNNRLQDLKFALDYGNECVNKMEDSVRPILNEVNELDEKIKKGEHIEETSQQFDQLNKMLAWLCVYEVDGNSNKLASCLKS